MKNQNIKELYYIVPIANIKSILKYGILSHDRVKKLKHASIAMPEIQNRRKFKRVPGGLYLHNYVNLYFDARNPMLYKRKTQHQDFCVLQIKKTVLELPAVIIADGNASSDYTRFGSFPQIFNSMDWNGIFAEYWTDGDAIAYYYKKRIKCAEVLIPQRLSPDFIFGAYVSGESSKILLIEQGFNLSIIIDQHLFFR